MCGSPVGRMAIAAAFLTAVVLRDSARLAAQSVTLGLGAGGVLPLGDYSDVDNLGWQGMVLAVVGIPSSPLAVRVDGSYGQTEHKGSIPGHSSIWGGTLDLVTYLASPASELRPYLLAGGGVYDVDRQHLSSASGTAAAFNGGLGLSAGIGAHGKHDVFIEARFVSVRISGAVTNFIPITLGLGFGL